VFRAIGGDAGEPDFTPLEDRFEILARNRQTSIKWINGRREQSTTWVLNAMPLETGTLEIPPIAFGSEKSPARTVEVVAQATGQTPAQADVLLEVDASPRDPYVQQQVIFTIRLLHRVDLSSPRFSPITASGDAVIKPLGDGSQSTRRIDGVTYEVFEQRYAVFPQQSGPLTIEPLVLTTQIVTGTRSLFDPFSQSLQTRRVESDAIELDVRPVPAAFPAGATWLPARRLRLHEEWEPDAGSAETGTPISRTLFLWADGLLAGQLPKLAPEVPDGVKVYPDQAQSNEQDTATGFTAVQQQKFALIAGDAGRHSFPPLTLPWWNTETDTLEQATLPVRHIDFRAAAGSAGLPAPAPASPQADAAAPATAPDATSTVAAGADGNDGLPAAPAGAGGAGARSWMVASGVLAIGWLATLLAWWRSRARRPGSASTHDANAAAPGDTPGAAAAARALKEACARDQADAARSALIAWARSRDPDARCRSLRDVARLVETRELAAAIVALERSLYGRSDTDWQGNTLWHAFQREPRSPRRARAARPTATTLPPMFRLVGDTDTPP
ncbi:MAG: BatD family protein, partial [Gammaproteobacteria bacterium]